MRGKGEGMEVPLKFPFYVVFGIELSMIFFEGSCAGGRGIRFCRFGSGRFCCRRARRACPVGKIVIISIFLALSVPHECL